MSGKILIPSRALDVGPLHFVGIGGIGMSGIAEVMSDLGYRVQGSDIRDSPIVQRLRDNGAHIAIGHAASNVASAGVLVLSSAIDAGNPEIKAARAAGIPIIRRADMLAELARLKPTLAVAGTHGKTTTVSLVATVLDGMKCDPTVINGGVIAAYGSNAKTGKGEWMVVEADESDGTFTRLRPRIAIVTNIDPEHMDHYGDMDGLRSVFRAFIHNLPFYGFAVLCTDHPEVDALARSTHDRRIVRCGLAEHSDVRAVNLRHDGAKTMFDLKIGPGRGIPGIEGPAAWTDICLPMAGQHNVQNAVAAIAAALAFGCDEKTCKETLAGFRGVKRRFTLIADSAGVRVVDDYAHHPVEISAVLKAARDMQGDGRILAVVQPHRYSRLKSLLADFCACFDDADHVYVLPVYAAGESPDIGVDHRTLAHGLIARGHPGIHCVDRLAEMPEEICSVVKPGDLVLCLGAGDITREAALLAEKIQTRAHVPDTRK